MSNSHHFSPSLSLTKNLFEYLPKIVIVCRRFFIFWNDMTQGTSLYEIHAALHQQTLDTIHKLERAKKATGYTPSWAYATHRLFASIQQTIQTYCADQYAHMSVWPLLIHRIDRAMYQADLTIKFDTALVRQRGKEFTSSFLPAVVARLSTQTALPFAQIEQKGIYINVTLQIVFWQSITDEILTLSNRYGDVDSFAWRTALIEYSSPNAAKHLHAGHIRSTVIGSVLSSLYDHAGYTVHRINHINDRGGFGQLIEGRKRWHDILYDQWLRDNDLNYQIYTIRRQAETLNNLRDASQAEQLKPYLPHHDQASFKEAFETFSTQAVSAFHALEQGNHEVYEIWQAIVASSMVEFETFYDKLQITHDYTIGESFYEKLGRQCIEQWETTWIIVTFTEKLAYAYMQEFDAAHPDIDSQLRTQKHADILNDVNAKVVLLDNRERFVVLRSDGASIYATRDLGCLWYRCQTWHPDVIVYEVGQEQEDHFQKLFETAGKLGRLDKDDGTRIRCLHIAHGFYVDATTKKKLSSRAGASNVHALIDASIHYFKEKYTQKEHAFTAEEVQHNAKTLGTASLILHDLSKNRMDPVLVDGDLHKTIQWFEQSWGAYLLYTICRAKSLLQKATVSRNDGSVAYDAIPNDVVIALLQLLSDAPFLLQKAVEQNEPSVLVQYAYHLTQAFNKIYGTWDRMTDNPHALRLTACYIQVMSNVLSMCGIEPLERM